MFLSSCRPAAARRRHARLDAGATILRCRSKTCFMLLAVIDERPLFGVVIVVEQGEDHFLHVSRIGRREVRRVHES